MRELCCRLNVVTYGGHCDNGMSKKTDTESGATTIAGRRRPLAAALCLTGSASRGVQL